MTQTNREFADRAGGERSQAELVLAGYELLRLTPGRLRKALRAMAGPVLRLHHWRNARTQLLRDALCEVDCGPPWPGQGA